MSLRSGVLTVVLLLFAVSANAENMVARDSAGNSVILHSEKCAISAWTKDWFTATFFYQNKTYAACWRLQGETVVILDSAGDVTPLPLMAFKPETSV